jgi:DNA-binding transcriptional ArsR family regulator
LLLRAGGNPLYAEQFARMLAEGGTVGDALPETVQGIIAARLDSLAEEEKRLLQDAAVLGKVFWAGSLASITGSEQTAVEQHLRTLGRKEFIRRERRSSVEGELEYAFNHVLVRDVAYGQIPRGQRVDKHRRAAEWIDSLSSERSEDRAEMLAHHYREALKLAEASGADTGPFRSAACDALVEASERAASLSSWTTSGELAAEALACITDADPRRPMLQLRLARSRGWGGAAEIDIPLAEAARDGFLEQDDRGGAAEAEAFLGWATWWQGDGEGARAHAAASLELARDLPTSLAKALAYARAARLEAIGGDPHRGIELANEALAMADELDNDELRSDALNSRGIGKNKQDEPTAIDDLRRSVELADAANAAPSMATSRNNLASVLATHGRVREALSICIEARDIGLRLGNVTSAQFPAMQILHNKAMNSGNKPTRAARCTSGRASRSGACLPCADVSRKPPRWSRRVLPQPG